jgi:hypothetical protein
MSPGCISTGPGVGHSLAVEVAGIESCVDERVDVADKGDEHVDTVVRVSARELPVDERAQTSASHLAGASNAEVDVMTSDRPGAIVQGSWGATMGVNSCRTMRPLIDRHWSLCKTKGAIVTAGVRRRRR